MSLVHVVAAIMGEAWTAPPGSAPDPPTNLVITDNSTCTLCSASISVVLTWDLPLSSLMTRIRRNGVTQVTTSAGVETWADTTAIPGVSYTYTLSTYDGSLYSTTINDTNTADPCIEMDPPTVNLSLGPTNPDTEVYIGVDSQTGADTFNVYRAGTSTLVGSASVGVSVVDASRTPGTLYSYDVEIVSDTGCTSALTEDQDIYTDLEAPDITVTATGINTIEIDVSTQNGADEWEVYRAGTATLVGTITNPAVPLEDTARTPNTAYSYDVVATDSSGLRGDSEATTGGATTMPNEITGIAASQLTGSCPSVVVNITWDVGTNTTHTITLQRKDPGGSFTTIATKSAGTESHQDTGATGDEVEDTEYRATFTGIGIYDTVATPVFCSGGG